MNSDNYIQRIVENYAFDENLTGRHMVFLAGPRQVGKTMLARQWLNKNHCDPLYFNWDDIKIRQSYFSDSRFFESSARTLGIQDPWIVFDEIHKRSHWRDILKGVYDLFKDDFRFLITGSARLDLFRRSGDSLVGRYNLFHLMPLNIPEVIGKTDQDCFLKEKDPVKLAKIFKDKIEDPTGQDVIDAYKCLRQYGPFPEPFIKQNHRFSRKWHQDYQSLMVRQEIRDISRVMELDKIENLLFLLPSRIMSPLSMANMARELEVAHTTVKNWLEQLKRLYLIFPVTTWSKNVARGLKKEKKWYFLDWKYAPEGAACLENMTATYLYRTCLALEDMGYGGYTLHYLRTLDKKEIDFIIVHDNKPVMAVEVKSGDTNLSKQLANRRKWLPDNPTLGIQVVDKRHELKKYPDNTWVVSVENLLALLI